MTPLKLYRKADGWLLTKAQDAYLWLLDRTGIYVGTIMMACFSIVTVYNVATASAFSTKIILVTLLFFVSLVCIWMYYLQDKGQNEIFNSIALSWEGSTIRHGIFGYQIGGLIADLCVRDYGQAFITLFLVAIIFVQAVKIRDRDKKPFFEKKEEPSLQGAS